MESMVLEVAVGLALLYYVTATLVSGVAEGLTRLMNTRSKMLWATLERLLQDSSDVRSLGAPFVFQSLAGGKSKDSRPSFGQPPADDASAPATRLAELATAPSISGTDYVTDGKTKVSTIPGRVFAAALLEIATVKASDDKTLKGTLTSLAQHYDGSPLGRYLTTVAEHVGEDLDKVTDLLSGWFDDQMVRVTQTYRKNIKYVLAVIGLVLAVVCNIDSIHVANALKGNADLRQVVVATAGTMTPGTGCKLDKDDATLNTLKCGLQDLSTFNAMGVVVPTTDGAWDRWKQRWTSDSPWPHLLGLALTTGAVALGGPMWFDFLMMLTGRKKSG
ncbi:MAG: hypothetical protein ABJA74_07875 [Lapillicoccus sp.]